MVTNESIKQRLLDECMESYRAITSAQENWRTDIIVHEAQYLAHCIPKLLALAEANEGLVEALEEIDPSDCWCVDVKGVLNECKSCKAGKALTTYHQKIDSLFPTEK